MLAKKLEPATFVLRPDVWARVERYESLGFAKALAKWAIPVVQYYPPSAK